MDLNTYVNPYVTAAELEQAVIRAERARVVAERLGPRPGLLRRLFARAASTSSPATTRRPARELAECTPHAA
jgi:hypothetical protein